VYGSESRAAADKCAVETNIQSSAGWRGTMWLVLDGSNEAKCSIASILFFPLSNKLTLRLGYLPDLFMTHNIHVMGYLFYHLCRLTIWLMGCA